MVLFKYCKKKMPKRCFNSTKCVQKLKKYILQFEHKKPSSYQTFFSKDCPQNNFNNLKQQLKSLFLCQICRQIMIYPTRLQCGHAFCLRCSELYLYCKGSCAVCKSAQVIQEYSVCNMLEDQIKELYLILEQNQKKIYQNRIDNFQQQEKRRSVMGCFSTDMFIDFRDVESNIWRQGKIIDVYCQNDIKQDVIIIQPLTNNCEKFIFRISSRNIATFGYFTQNKISVNYALFGEEMFERDEAITLCQSISNNRQDLQEKQKNKSFYHLRPSKSRFGKISGKRPNPPSSQKNVKKTFYQKSNAKNWSNSQKDQSRFPCKKDKPKSENYFFSSHCHNHS